VVVDGRSFFMREWWAAKRKKKEERHKNRTETTREYRERGERSDKWRETLNAGRLFHGVTMAMDKGHIAVREHQVMATDLTKGQYTIQNLTAVRIEVGRDILGGMVTALEKAGDSSGMFVEGVVKWKTKNAREKDKRHQKRQRGGTRTRRTRQQDEGRTERRPRMEEEDWTGLLVGRDLDN